MTRLRRAWLLLLATLFVGAPFAFAQTGDELRDQQWNLDSVQVESMRSYGRGSGAVVSVVSTGIDASHPDLVGQISGGRNLLNESAPPSDQSGLGTHMSGIVAAITDNGEGVASIAPHSKIMPVKALDQGANSSSQDRFLTALRYAGSPVEGIPIKVVLFTLPRNWPIDGERDGDLQDAINDIVADGVLLVTGAGLTDHYGGTPVIRVAGLNEADLRTPDSGSPTAAFGLCAPGDRIMSTWTQAVIADDYSEQNGIDQAAAHVAGAAAVLMGKGLTSGQTAAVLFASARNVSATAPDCGHGALDLAKAAHLAATPPPATPPTTDKKPPDTTAPPGNTTAPTQPAPVASAPTLGPVSPTRADRPNPFAGPEQPAEPPANALELQDDGGGANDRPWGLLAVALGGLFLSFGGLSRTMLKLASVPAE